MKAAEARPSLHLSNCLIVGNLMPRLNIMSNYLTPHYLSSLIPQPVGAISRYNLRNSYDLTDTGSSN